MSNAAIFFHPEGFDTRQPKLMGRHAAGESFLRGFIRYADVDRLIFFEPSLQSRPGLEALVQRIEPTQKPMTWLGWRDFPRLAEPGVLLVQGPAMTAPAWTRRRVGADRYSLCGLTHTTASTGAMDGILEMLTAPVEPWDSLICTSSAVKATVERQLGMASEHLRDRLGATRIPRPRLDVIPLGINAEDYAHSPAHRARWRAELGIPEDAIVVLYVGRFAPHAKMNPIPMAMALERAAQRTKRPVHWLMVGWAANEFLHEAFVGAGRRHAPSVVSHVLDGRPPEVRFSIWSAGDVFFSLSDNIQETFGLTPVEAMAAGLPSVISDWDGYRDLVRNQLDGFRVPAVMARGGLGGDLALTHANGWQSYDRYVGEASQFVSVDIAAAADALTALIDNDDLRARMGASALERARTVFDWKTVIGQYQGLWTELAAVRAAAPPSQPSLSENPWRPDPFNLFAAYPTAIAGSEMLVTATGSAAAALAIMSDPSISYAQPVLPTRDTIETIFALLQEGPASVGDIAAGFPPPTRGAVERGLVWLAKIGQVTLSPTPELWSE